MDKADSLRDYVRETVEHLDARSDDAWHSLVSLGRVALPHVLHAYNATNDLDKKVALLSVVGEYRTHHALEFLAVALASREDQIWKSALDGLVMLGGESAKRVLNDALVSAQPTKREWIAEAITQIQTTIEDS